MQFLSPLKLRSAFQKISLVTESHHVRCKTTGNVGKSSIEEIPEKPKRPANAYIRFLKDVEGRIAAEHPEYSRFERLKAAGELWKNSDDITKAPYLLAHKTDSENYNEAVQTYNLSLTEEQKAAIFFKTEMERERRNKKNYKKAMEKLGKPKRPPSAFGLYMSDNKGSSAIHEAGKWMEKITIDWRNLSENEKQEYLNRADDLRKKYSAELSAWESKIMNTFGTVDKIPVKKLLKKNVNISDEIDIINQTNKNNQSEAPKSKKPGLLASVFDKMKK